MSATPVARLYPPATSSLVDVSLFVERGVLEQCARQLPKFRLALENMVVDGGKHVPTHRRQDSASPELCGSLVHLIAHEDCTSNYNSEGGIALPYLDSD